MKEPREQKVARLHDEELSKWGFHARDRDRPWILEVDHPVERRCRVTGHEFDSEWVSLRKDGTVTVHAGPDRHYAWDGCTPKLVFRNFRKMPQFVFGTPDGYSDINTKLPLTGEASLIHDAFYQYLHVIPFSKTEVDRVFRDILEKDGFSLWPLYYIFVLLFGGRGVKQEGLYGVYYEKYRPIYLANASGGRPAVKGETAQ